MRTISVRPFSKNPRGILLTALATIAIVVVLSPFVSPPRTHAAFCPTPSTCGDDNYDTKNPKCLDSAPDTEEICRNQCSGNFSCCYTLGVDTACRGTDVHCGQKTLYCCRCYAPIPPGGNECTGAPTIKYGECSRSEPTNPIPYCQSACGDAGACKVEPNFGLSRDCPGGDQGAPKKEYACSCYGYQIRRPRYGGINQENVCTATLPGYLGGTTYEGIKSGLGCIPLDYKTVSVWVLGIALGLAAGFAVLMIIISGYGILTSQGDPEKLQEAKGTLTAAISGLLFIILSVTIFRLVARTLFSG